MFDFFFTQNIIFLAISIILPFFTSKAYDTFVEKQQLDCDKSTTNVNHHTCQVNQNKINDEYDMNKLMYMIIIGFGCIVSGYLASIFASNTSLKGISVGGLILLLWNLLINWRLFDQKKQVMILGIILSCFLIMGTQTKYLVNFTS